MNVSNVKCNTFKYFLSPVKNQQQCKAGGSRWTCVYRLSHVILKMEAPASKKSRLLDNSFLRSDLNDEETVKIIKSAWESPSDIFSKNGVEIIHNPFRVCMIKHFVDNPDLLISAAGELKDVIFHEKSNDLYQFKQSDDVKNLTNFTFIPQLYDLIKVQGRKCVNDIVGGTKLNEEISATFSSYGYQDRLLCHDDKCEDRHIAFILYLVENWDENDGGLLELFNTDSNGHPSEIVKSICPEFNMMIFFEVTQHSFHQVSEVISKEKKRISLNGWFHCSGKKLDRVNCKILETKKILANDKDFNLEQYFLFTYFDVMNKVDIKMIFLTESEIQLDEFIVATFLEQIENDLKSETLKWVTKGPPNMRKYEMADPTSLPPSLKTLKEIFESKCWFHYLKAITALDLSPSETTDLEIWEKGILPVCDFEIQRWTRSCYTLVHDQDPEFHTEALDVFLRIPFEREGDSEVEEKDAPEGGHIIYLDSESKDEECLLHIGYKMNSLGLIFRDNKTLRFTKYLDSTSKSFYQILCTYRPWKPPVDQPDLKHCKDDDDDETEDSLSEDCS